MNAVHLKMEKVRKEKGVSKTHISHKCGHTVSWYSAISKGRRKPNVDSIQAIAKALEVEPAIFFTD